MGGIILQDYMIRLLSTNPCQKCHPDLLRLGQNPGTGCQVWVSFHPMAGPGDLPSGPTEQGCETTPALLLKSLSLSKLPPSLGEKPRSLKDMMGGLPHPRQESRAFPKSKSSAAEPPRWPCFTPYTETSSGQPRVRKSLR